MESDSLVSPEALRHARVRVGLTQHELARLIGVAGGERVSRWERGASAPRPEVLHRIAAAVDIPVDELLVPAQGGPDLRRLRVLAGLSARQVAEQAHLSLPTYARWEAGRIDRIPPTAAIEGLAAALSVSVDDTTAALSVARRGSA
ncbi:Helix-turn-helix domain protein [Nostocoides japonicum T1-X7]|uniref:Helix-turn-helix domain protein n=1 Tax=Nostocoides japonicum T1-X7 TaxID=1194083 RepID=A0A077LSU8_9MICO|nr:helix-turn-helix transcriptional regulator [Tetrasphaera japonica]CCH75936.1 Helix-turn-helix domain protein [Tetrasphaera japonica T1-X7]